MTNHVYKGTSIGVEEGGDEGIFIFCLCPLLLTYIWFNATEKVVVLRKVTHYLYIFFDLLNIEK